MLEKLVISKSNNKETKKLKGLLFATSTIAFSGVMFALVFSLFSENLAMGIDSVSLSSMITPPRIIEEKPLEPKPEKNKNPQKTNLKTKVAVRKHNILRLDETPQKLPNAISTKPSENMARPNFKFELGALDKTPSLGSTADSSSNSKEGVGPGFSKTQPEPIKNEKLEAKKPEKPIQKMPPPPKPAVAKNTVVSGGVVNGKAKRLVKPVYSQAAKAAQIRGQVTVQVLINENGKVISANATNGHQLLRKDAVSAALRSTFTPTYLSDNKVQVQGFIVYNFN